MNQTIKTVALCAALITASVSMRAQEDEIKLIQGMYGIEKREIVKQYIQLNDEESKKFWPLYDQYEAERQKLGADRIKIIGEYATSYDTLGANQADKLATSALDNDIELGKLHKKYYGKMKKDLGPLKTASFFQLEKYLQTTIMYEIQDNIPFIGELDRKKKK